MTKRSATTTVPISVSMPWEGLFPELPFVRAKDLPKETGLSDARIYELIELGEFPPLVKIAPRASGVPANWLQAWLAFRVEASIAAAKRRTVI